MKKLSKFASISLSVTTILWSIGASFIPFVPVAKAAIADGAIISSTTTFVDADGSTYYPYDVFIVKLVGSKMFKRLILNPQVFTSYAHLKWSNIQKVSADTVKAYKTSALVRAINDSPVYVLAPNGDMGTKQWVDDITCFNSKGYDWDSVYTINATDRDNYTTTTSLCGGVGGGGALNLVLASDTAPAATITRTAQDLSYTKVNITGSGTINQLTITRGGAGAVSDFDNIYIYQNGVRLTSARSLSTDTGKVTFINLGLVAPTSIEIVADMVSTDAVVGDVNYLGIAAASDVTANGTVGGAFPINGNPMIVGGQVGGTITVVRSGGSTADVTIGAVGIEISQFKITTATEGAYVKRVKLLNDGSADNDKITNLILKDNLGTTLATATSITTAGYADFVFSSPYYIKKGESQIFRVYATIGATKPDRTIKLYPELSSDIYATGSIYGFGLAATTTGYASGALVTVTVKGGDLTLNKIGPVAANIGTDTTGTNFLEFSMSAAADITIKRTKLDFCQYGTASASAGANITNIEIKDKDSGNVVIGPKDGTSFNDGTLTASTCGTGYTGVYEAFTDTLDLSAGTTRTFQVTADIDTSTTVSGGAISSADQIKFILSSYATLVGTDGTVAYMKYADTSDPVAGTAIAPSGDIAGDVMTIQSSGLTLSLAATPSGSGATARTFIKGQSGVDAVGIIFKASNASAMTINSITLTAYTSEDALATRVFTAGVDTNYVKDTIGNVYIYDKDTAALIPGSTAKGFSGSNSSLVEYTGLNWVIPAGTEKTLLVKSDISSAAPASASSADTFISFDIVSDNVSAVDGNGNTVTPTGYSANNATSPSTYFGVASYGSLAIVAASDTPDKSIAVMGTNDNEVSKFKLTATSEAWYIDKFSVVLDDGQGIDDANRDNFSAAKLKYQTEVQKGTSNWTITAGKIFGSTASLAFSFSGSDRIYVPRDDSTYVTALVSIATYNGGNGAKSKVPFKLYPITGGTSSFEAYGAQSGHQLFDVTEPASTGFNLSYVARSKPVFAKEAWSGGEAELARFDITAVGYDIVFTGNDDLLSTDIGSAALQFDIVASSTDDESGLLYLYDWNENIISSTTATTWGSGSGTYVTFGFEVGTSGGTTTVPQDTTKTFHVDLRGADLSDFGKTDEYIYLLLKNDDGGTKATGYTTGVDADEYGTKSWQAGSYNIVYNDGSNMEGISGVSSPEKRFGVPSLIKNIGPLPLTFRTLRGTAAP